jgi:Tol biopolymer transport system component
MHVWVLDLPSGVAKPLSGTEGGHRPFWAPDGKSIGFFTWGSLATIPAEGGAVRRLAVARDARGGTWSPNGTILFAPYQRGSLWTVSEQGGKAVEITTTGREILGTHRFPQFLPDGEHFIYLDRPAPLGPRTGSSAVLVGRLGTTEPVARLVELATNAVYADGHLLYVRDGALVAQPFDPSRRETRGEPTALVGDVLYNRRFSYGVFSAGGSGALAFLTGRQRDLSQLVWRDRSGRRLGELGTPGILSGYGGLALSRDGRLAAVARVDEGTSEADIWLYDLERGSESRLVRPGDDGDPVFAAGGGQMYFGSSTENVGVLMKRDLTSGSEAPLFSVTGSYIVALASVRDGAAVLYTTPTLDGGSDLLLRPTAGGGEAAVVVGTPADELYGQVSPDGRWLAWASDESGRYEVFVGSFPDARGSRFQVSHDGGTQPRWHPKGAELFFKTPDNMLTAVPIEASSSTFSVGTPTALFRIVEFTGWTYAVAPDGERFLVRERLAERDASPITLLTDWGSLVKRQ